MMTTCHSDPEYTSVILDGTTFSYSNLTAFETCPKMWFFKYIRQTKDQTNNAYAQWGSLIHAAYKKYYSGEKTKAELITDYIADYENKVSEPFPFGAGDKYYSDGVDIISHFLPTDYEIVALEQKFNFWIAGHKFVGYIDMIVRTPDDEYIIIDHKSKSAFSNEKEKQKYLRQLYLYSMYIKENYYKYPKALVFNMFRTGEQIVEEFKEKKYFATIAWAATLIDEMYQTEYFIDKVLKKYTAADKSIDDFEKTDWFCNQLCGLRLICPRSDKFEEDEGDV